MPNIVTVNVSQIIASAPITLQQTGAIVTQGGTNTAANTVTLLTQASDLTPILNTSVVISSMTWSGAIVSVTTATPHGMPDGKDMLGTIAGVTPAGYNGTFLMTSTGTTTFTYPLSVNPGAVTVEGTFILNAVSQLRAQVTTWFAQSGANAVYVLELGAADTASGVMDLTSYINSPSVKMYSYLLPKEWDLESTAPSMARVFDGTTAQVYFNVTTTVSTYTSWENIKSVLCTLQSPLANPATEFDAAIVFWNQLSRIPSASAPMNGMQYNFVANATPYSTLTGAQKTALALAGVNWIDTGAQGQISNSIIQNGAYMDKNPFTYWYAVDWAIEHLQIELAATIINGSQPQPNPLTYNQTGINTLQRVCQSILDTGTAFNLLLAGSIVTAIPFSTYVVQNPSDYAVGVYNGLAATITPARSFVSITINLTASNIPT